MGTAKLCHVVMAPVLIRLLQVIQSPLEAACAVEANINYHPCENLSAKHALPHQRIH
jgi:hypothetical protein